MATKVGRRVGSGSPLFTQDLWTGRLWLAPLLRQLSYYFLASIFGRRPVIRVEFGEVLCPSVKHTLQKDEHFLKGLCNYWCDFLNFFLIPVRLHLLSEKCSGSSSPSWDSRDTRKWTNLPWAWFNSFWLSSIKGLNHGSLSSGYCGSYGNVLRAAAWQAAAQRGAWGPKCPPGSRESWHPKTPVLSGACLFSLLLWN